MSIFVRQYNMYRIVARIRSQVIQKEYVEINSNKKNDKSKLQDEDFTLGWPVVQYGYGGKNDNQYRKIGPLGEGKVELSRYWVR